ncbi:MAG: hypothetical protein NVSMB21_20540 [Vulcanimicrobiaceae bacterium]
MIRRVASALCLVLSFVLAAGRPSAGGDAAITVTGTVVDAAERPVSDAIVAIVPAEDTTAARAIATTNSDGTGRFALYGLTLVGRYAITATSQQSGDSGYVERQLNGTERDRTIDVRIALRATTTRGAPSRQAFTMVRVHYATDRARGPSDDATAFYANGRSEGGTVRYGTADVSIPATHERGIVEGLTLGDYLRLEFKPDPKKHVVLERVTEQTPSSFFTDLATDGRQRRSKQILVFVHGFNESFEQAARLAAQMKFDLLPLDVAMVLYSWPSHANLLAYADDARENDRTVPQLAAFLERVSREAGGAHVSIVAHSMGNRALTQALRSLATNATQPLFDQIIMAAPDVPSTDLATSSCRLARTARGVTLYASQHDQALLASAALWHQARAGLVNPLFIGAGIDTIDASGALTDFLGHGYFSRNNEILSDIEDVLKSDPPPRKHLVDQASAKDLYWRFVAEQPIGYAPPRRGPAKCPAS